MARNTNIKLRRSATAGAIPTTSNLDLGELALNTYDGKLYMKTTEGSLDNVIQVGSATDSYYKVRKSQTLTFEVKVASKTTDHIHYNSGSSSGYQIDGVESPHFNLIPGNTYRFDQSDSSNSGHPLRFYYDSGKTTAYTTGVTTNGTPGSSGAYTQIVPTVDTPMVLHYQCSAHGLMGNQVSFKTRNLTGFDTDDLSEGSSNLYFTNARADARIAAANTGDLSEGSNLYFTTARVDAHLNQSNPTSGYVLSWNGSDYAWVDNAGYTDSDVESYLDANGISLPDNIIGKFGTGNDLQIYHDGTNSSIQNATGDLFIYGGTDDIRIRAKNDEESIVAAPNGAVTLYYDGSAKLATTTAGINVTGSIDATNHISLPDSKYLRLGDDNDFIIYHDGTSNYIQTIKQDSDLIFRGNDGGTNFNALTIDMSAGGAATFADNVTVGGNAIITGNLTVSGTTTTLNTATLDVEDKNITLNKGSGDTSGSANGAGLTIQDAVNASTDATILWDATNDRFDFSHPVTVVNNNTTDTLLLTSTEDSSSAAPVITLKRNSSSPADADYLGQLKFKGENDADQEVIYAKVTAKIQDASDGSEDGILEFANKKAGSNVITARLRSDSLQLLNGTSLVVAGLTYPTSDGTSGQALVTDGSGNLSFSTISSGGGTVTEAFKNIAVSGQTNIVADAATDTLTFAAGSNITLTTTPGTDTLTIAASGGEVTVQDEGSSLSTAATTLNFVGAGVTASGTGATKTITIAGGATTSQSAVYKEYIFNPSSSTTTFTGSDANGHTLSYTVGFIKVYLNGVLLKPTTDYTATNGTSVVLVNAAGSGDCLQISTFVQLVGTGDSSLSELTGNGSTTAFTIAADPNHENNTQVYIDGVYQEKGTYSVSGTTLTFSSAPPSGSSIEVVIGSRNVTIDDVAGLTVKGDLNVTGDSYEFKLNSDDFNIARIIPRGSSGGDLDKGLLSLFDGSTEDVRIDTAGNSWFNGGPIGIGTVTPGVSLDVGSKTDALRVPNGTTAQRPTAATGQLRYNTTTSEFEGYANGAWGKIGGGDSFGTIAVSGQSNVVADQENDTLTFVAGTGITLTTNASGDSITVTNSATGDNAFGTIAVSGQSNIAADSTNDTLTIVGAGGITATTTAGTDTLTLTGQTSVNPFTTDFFTASGSAAFTLSVTPPSEDNLIVFLEGVYQNKNSYALSGTTLTLDSTPTSGSEVVVHIIQNGVVGAGHTVDEFTGDGSDTTFTLSVAPLNENNTFVYLDGVYQEKSVYSVSGTTLTFATAPVSGHSIEVVTPQVTEINQPATDSINAIGMFDDTTMMGSTVTSTTMTTTSATTIATHAAATYRTIKYLVQLTQGTDYHATEINLIHDGTTVYITEYGTLFDNAALGTLNATISSGNILLQLTPGSNSSLTARVVSTAIPV